ncbi:MAG: ferrous iron transport protein B [Bacillota bacterium]|nr:ferrous iron transport protein B [Bacillota bacterium]
MTTLRELKPGQQGRITAVGGEGNLRQHFLDMGVIPGEEVAVVKYAPMGDPMELTIQGYRLTLRLADAEKIQVDRESPGSRRQEEAAAADSRMDGTVSTGGRGSDEDQAGAGRRPALDPSPEHPGLGEGGRFHPKGSGDPLPDDAVLSLALVGNQNCGKTTLFNQLTGANQHVGNFPGVTVDRKDGVIKGHPETVVTDLPGIYSMSPYSSEEIVSRNFVLEEKPRGIINIVDATNIERNLYLTMQLLEMDVPMVVALNMMDEVAAGGGSIDINSMEAQLGVPVIAISAAKNQGVRELVDHALHVAKYQEKPLRQDFCEPTEAGGAVHRCLHGIIHLIEDHAVQAGLPVRFAADKLIEGDPLIAEQLKLEPNEAEMVEHIILQMEKERGLDRSAAIADMRFSFIHRVCCGTVRYPRESRTRIRSEKIDQILTGKYTAIPLFFGIMGLVFWLTFNVIGAVLQNLVATGVGILTRIVDQILTATDVNAAIHSLIIKGIFEGVGVVLSFLPIIVTLFFFLSILEDSGYIARVAFFMDKLLRKIGLSGRSIVPMLIGFGCTVPAVMATRTLPSERDRKMTILLTPFMSCSAKVPIYAFFTSAFFPGHGALIMIGLYVFGVLLGILAAFVYKKIFRGEAVPFVMELPDYRMPGAGNVLCLMWDKAKDFLQRAFTIILLATIVIWFLKSFDPHMNMVTDSQDSMLAIIAGWLTPVMAPAGLGDWRICTALIAGFIAKETVVSTLGILFAGNIAGAMSALTAVCLLVFSLLYTPCVAAIASTRRELGWGWALGVVVWQCVIAWVMAALTFQIGGMIL